MALFTPLAGPVDFDGGYFIEWAARPPAYPPNPLAPGTPCNHGTADYVYPQLPQTVRIDVGGPQVTLSVCDDNHIPGQFTPGESLLVGDNEASKMPVHLFFQPPVRRVGARVAAGGNAGESFLGMLQVRDAATGTWSGTSRLAQVSLGFDSAPFVGLGSDGLIDEAWFDVMSPGGQDHFPQVLVGSLYFVQP